MRIFLLSVYFYLSNLFFDFSSPFSFEPNFFEFLTIFLAIFLANQISASKLILSLWAFLYFFAFCYIKFAGHIPTPAEISLFWTHKAETFESFFALYHLFIAPFIFLCGAFLVIFAQKPTKPNFKIFAFWLLILFFVPFNFADSSINLLKNTAQSFSLKTPTTEIKTTDTKPKYKPKYKNILVIIGESMRHDKLSLFGANAKYSPNLENLKDKLNSKTIYSNGTNTDVSLPLFFNATQYLDKLDGKTNLFSLAKNANFDTHFISAQTIGYLKYITPYFGPNVNPKILGTKNDLDLPNELQKIDWNRSNFAVFQMMGEHSPYKFYEKRFDKFGDYENCVLQSDFVLAQIFKFAIANNIAVLYFSDHGELLGENDGFYGHNAFKTQVYQVPFIWTNFKEGQFASSQNDIAQILITLFGYEKVPNLAKTIKVNGSMITGEDGFREFKR